MWRKGPQPGYHPKDEALRLCPGATCRKKTSGSITGYVVYSPDGKAVASARKARDAWEKAASEFIRRTT